MGEEEEKRRKRDSPSRDARLFWQTGATQTHTHIHTLSVSLSLLPGW
jgi:hypothetical protein